MSTVRIENPGDAEGAKAAVKEGTVVSAVSWSVVALSFITAFAIGALLAVIVKGVGWWPGAGWENDIIHVVHRTVNPVLDTIMLVLPLFGTNYSLAPIVAVVAVILWRREYHAVALHMLVVQAGSWALNPALKFTFPRERPMLYEQRGQHAFPAFPSGHSIAVVAVMLTAALLLYHYRGKTWGFWVVGAFFLLNSYSRIYLSVHWPTDLIAGTLVGGIWMVGCWKAFERTHRGKARD